MGGICFIKLNPTVSPGIYISKNPSIIKIENKHRLIEKRPYRSTPKERMGNGIRKNNLFKYSIIYIKFETVSNQGQGSV